MGWAGAGVVSGALLAALAGVSVVYWPTIYNNQLAKRLIVTNTSMSYDIWKETPIPMYLEFYMWNCTNVDEVLASRATPSFHEMGPYVFREVHVKTNLSWHPENSTVSFYNNRTWHYEPLMSRGSLDDLVTNLNVVIAATAYSMRLRSVLLRPFVNTFLESMHEHMFVTATVREWLFEGIEDPVIDWAVQYNISVGIPFDRFGWFYGRNGSEEFDGAFNMETGAADLTRLGNIARWKFSPRTTFRGDCGEVRGSTGELWPPETDQDTLTIFASDLCTYMELDRQRATAVEGVAGVRYAASSAVFDNGHTAPVAACYCDDAVSADCVPRGALNVSSCRYGAPAFVSFPHFYSADPVYTQRVHGMAPSREEHEFYLGLEQVTGIPLEVRAQLQINMLMRHVVGMPIANSLPDDTMVPMFWFRQEVKLTPEFASQARLALALRSGVLYTLYVLVAVGVCVLGVSTGLLVRRLVRQPAGDPLVGAKQEVEGGAAAPGAEGEVGDAAP